MFKEILKNLISLAATKFIAQLLAFFTTVYISRNLDVEQYGMIGFATAVLIYFDFISNFGLELFSTREVSKTHGKLSFFVVNSLVIRLLSTSFLILVLIIISLLNDDSQVIKLLLLFSLSLFLKALSINWIYAAMRKMEIYGFSQVVMQFFYLISVIILIQDQTDLLYVPVCLNIGTAFMVLFTWLISLKLGIKIKKEFNVSEWIQILKESTPMAISFIVIRVYLNFSLIYLGFLNEKILLGYYNAAFKIFFALFAIREILISVAFPLLSKFFVESKTNLKRIIEGFLKLATIIATPISVFGIIYSKTIILLIFGSEYELAYKPLQLLFISYFIMMLNVVFPSAQNAFNNQRKFLQISIVNSICNVCFNIIFIYFYGFLGAAMASVATDLVSLILFKAALGKFVIIDWKKSTFKVLIAVSIAVLPNLIFSSNIIIGLSVSMIIYILCLFYFKIFNKKEKQYLKTLFVNNY